MKRFLLVVFVVLSWVGASLCTTGKAMVASENMAKLTTIDLERSKSTRNLARMADVLHAAILAERAKQAGVTPLRLGYLPAVPLVRTVSGGSASSYDSISHELGYQAGLPVPTRQQCPTPDVKKNDFLRVVSTGSLASLAEEYECPTPKTDPM